MSLNEKPKIKLTLKHIDDQIESATKEIAELTQKLFQAQGMLQYAEHLKRTFKIKKGDTIAPSSPVRQ